MADTYKTIECPACGKAMKKIFIPSVGVNVDICSESCGGLFFDNQELQKFNKISDDVSEIKKALEGKSFISVDENQTRICPCCGKPMVKTSIKGLGVQIDTCYTCGGVFLDNGELDIIRERTRRVTVNDVKLQNGQLNEDVVRTFYREMQQENPLNERNGMMYDALFGHRSFGNFGRRRIGLIDVLFNLFW